MSDQKEILEQIAALEAEKKAIMKDIAKNERTSILDDIGKYAAIGGKSLAKLPGHIFDIGHAIVDPQNKLLRSLRGNSTLAERMDRSIDRMTRGYTKAETPNQRIFESVSDFAGPGIGGKIKALPGAIRTFLKPTVATTAGVATGQHILNENPDAHWSALGAATAIPTIAGIGKSLIKKGAQGVKNSLALSQLKENKNVQKGVEEEIAHLQGAKKIEPMSHESTGKRIILSAKRQKKQFKEYFNDRYSEIDDYVNKLTDFNTNEKRFIDVSDAANWLKDEYKKIESSTLKEEFLKSKPGESLRKLLGVERFPRAGDIKNDRKIVDILIQNDVPVPKVPYNDARQIQKNIQNTLSKAQEIGNVEEGMLKQVTQKLNENIGEIFNENKSIKDRWRVTNDEYGGYLEHRKPMINEIMKYKGSHAHKGKPYPGNPTGAFALAEKRIHENPDYLDFLLEGMKPDTQDSFVRGIIRNYGKDEGKYNAIKGSKEVSNLEEPVRNRLMQGLKKETREQFESPADLIKQYEHELAQPKINPIGSYIAEKAAGAIPGAALGAIAGPYGAGAGAIGGVLLKNKLMHHVTPNTTANAISALEKKMGKGRKPFSQSLGETAQETLQSSRPGLMIAAQKRVTPLIDVGKGGLSTIEAMDKPIAPSREEILKQIAALEAEKAEIISQYSSE